MVMYKDIYFCSYLQNPKNRFVQLSRQNYCTDYERFTKTVKPKIHSYDATIYPITESDST